MRQGQRGRGDHGEMLGFDRQLSKDIQQDSHMI